MQVLGYSIEKVSNLDHLAEHGGRLPTESGSTWTRIDKYVAETAHLVLLASRVDSDSGVARRVDALAEHLRPWVYNKHQLLKLMRFPRLALSTGQVYLAAAGHGDPMFDELIGSLVKDGYDRSAERSPTDEFAWRWRRGLVAAGAPGGEEASAVMRSTLDSRIPVPYLFRSELYSFTHAVWYLTDYGRTSPPPPVRAGDLGTTVDTALHLELVTGNLDLLAEFLMCVSALHVEWSAGARLAWRLLSQIWQQHRYLPGDNFDHGLYQALSSDDQVAYEFWTSYHPTQIFGKLCALLLDHEETGDSRGVPKASMSPLDLHGLTQRCRDSAEATEDFVVEAPQYDTAPSTELRGDSITSQIRRVYTRFPSRFSDALCALTGDDSAAAADIVDGACLRACRAYELETAIEFLRLAASIRSVPTRAFVESLDFVLRQQSPAGGFNKADSPDAHSAASLSRRIGAHLSALAVQLAEIEKGI